MEGKQILLRDFVEKYKNLAVQGTKEWEELRIIGGSDLHSLITNERSFVLSKCGLSSGFVKNLSMMWGTFNEDAARVITEDLFSTDIYESSCVPSVEVKDKTFSMDGMGVVALWCSRINSDNVYTEESKEFFKMYLLVLFEFKCPFTYKIKQNDIRKYYLPQVKSGLADLAIPDVALYIESVFRICEYSMLGNNKHFEKWLHPGMRTNDNPMAWFFVGIYTTPQNLLKAGGNKHSYKSSLNSVKHFIENGQVDFALLHNTREIETIFNLVKIGILSTWISKRSYTDSLQRCDFLKAQNISRTDTVDMDDELSKFYKHVRSVGSSPLGILGMKLFDMNIKPVEKEVGYTKSYEELITRAANNIRTLKAITDDRARSNKFYEMYQLPVYTGFDYIEEESQHTTTTMDMTGFDLY